MARTTPSHPLRPARSQALPLRVARPRTVRAAPPGDSTERIVESITGAIVERRLMPGTKLAEQKIADLFAVSRTIVRQALNQLSRDRLVTLEPARGARVAEPSVAEARQVFEVRRMLELGMVRRAATEFGAAEVAELRRHLRDEAAAVQRTDVPGRTRLLADFHVVLARLLGNEVLAGLLQDLVSRSSLIALMYQSAHGAVHSSTEHAAMVEAIARRDADGAEALMREHLDTVEHTLHLNPREVDLASALLPASA